MDSEKDKVKDKEQRLKSSSVDAFMGNNPEYTAEAFKLRILSKLSKIKNSSEKNLELEENSKQEEELKMLEQPDIKRSVSESNSLSSAFRISPSSLTRQLTLDENHSKRSSTSLSKKKKERDLHFSFDINDKAQASKKDKKKPESKSQLTLKLPNLTSK